MKVINLDSSFLVYQKIFHYLKTHQSSLVVWQTTDEKREVSETSLHSYNLESKLIHLALSEEVNVTASLPLYCYVEDGQFIFKSQIHELSEKSFSVTLPQEIHLLEAQELMAIKSQIGLDLSDVWKVKRLILDDETDSDEDLRVKSMSERTPRDQEFLNNEFNFMSLDEEEMLFADMRESPRARPKVDKFVHLKVGVDDSIHRMKLFDLSQGGMGILVEEVKNFSKGEKVEVVGFDDFGLDDPLFGKIMSLRETDESKREWKVGVKFDDGQA